MKIPIHDCDDQELVLSAPDPPTQRLTHKESHACDHQKVVLVAPDLITQRRSKRQSYLRRPEIVEKWISFNCLTIWGANCKPRQANITPNDRAARAGTARVVKYLFTMREYASTRFCKFKAPNSSTSFTSHHADMWRSVA